MKSGSNTPREIELKLDVEPQDLERVLAHPLLDAGSGDAGRNLTLHTTYFDTPDHALRRAGVSLRIRRNGTRSIQTIKAAPSAPTIAMARGEWENEVDGDHPDFTIAAETALKPFMELRDAIHPVFFIRTERTLHELAYGKSRIEVAADRSRIEGSEHTLSFSELELELKGGDAADLFGLALRLSTAAPLRLSFMTKAERGYDAGTAELPKKVKAVPITLRRRMTAAEAFQAIGASCLQHLMANEVIVRRAREADAVHQMRVALRRLRAAITLFKAVVVDDQRDRIRVELKWMANVLGEARDLDVYIAKVLEPAQAEHDEDGSYADLLAESRERRHRAYDTVQETITSARFVNGVLEAAAWIQAGLWLESDHKAARRRRNQRIVALAEEELERRWKKILKRGRNLAELDPEERHQVRIEIKKLRYGTEFFESLFKGGSARKRRRAALSALESLQETLGELNDIAVGSAMTSSSAAHAIHEAQMARVDDLVAAAKAQFAEFAALKRFWET
jgi:triphosphatase